MSSPKAATPTTGPVTTATQQAASEDPLLSQLHGVFTRAVPADKRAPTIDPEALRRPVIVVFVGARDIEYTKRDTNEKRKSTLYQFASQAGAGAHFSVFGNANLSTRLKKLTSRGPFVLAYNGRQDDEGRKIHEWQVVAPGGQGEAFTAARVKEIRATSAWVERERELDAVIGKALADENERLAGRRTSVSSDGARSIDDIAADDDLPF